MSKKIKPNPKMLTNVLQAVADLKDVNGSTSRKILDHVETAINIKNEKPKPRNVVMQVRRALSHAVDTGMLKHRAGKYRLTEKCHVKTCSKKKKDPCGKKPKKCSKPKRSGKSKNRKRKPCKRRHSSVATTSASYSISGYSRSIDSLPTDSDYTVRTARRGGRRKSRKGGHKSSRRRRSKSRKGRKSRKGSKRRRHRRSRQATPLSPPVEHNKSETGSERGGITRSGSRYQANVHDDFPCESFTDQREMDMPPQCDNPECLCNLKQEPYDDNNYDDMNGAGFMM